MSNTKQAMQWLIEGRKIRATEWAPEHFINIAQDGAIIDSNNKVLPLFFYSDMAWELYLEPKKTKKVKFLAYVSPSGNFVHYEEGRKLVIGCKRVPSQDFEAEVEE